MGTSKATVSTSFNYDAGGSNNYANDYNNTLDSKVTLDYLIGSGGYVRDDGLLREFSSDGTSVTFLGGAVGAGYSSKAIETFESAAPTSTTDFAVDSSLSLSDVQKALLLGRMVSGEVNSVSDLAYINCSVAREFFSSPSSSFGFGNGDNLDDLSEDGLSSVGLSLSQISEVSSLIQSAGSSSGSSGSSGSSSSGSVFAGAGSGSLDGMGYLISLENYHYLGFGDTRVSGIVSGATLSSSGSGSGTSGSGSSVEAGFSPKEVEAIGEFGVSASGFSKTPDASFKTSDRATRDAASLASTDTLTASSFGAEGDGEFPFFFVLGVKSAEASGILGLHAYQTYDKERYADSSNNVVAKDDPNMDPSMTTTVSVNEDLFPAASVDPDTNSLVSVFEKVDTVTETDPASPDYWTMISKTIPKTHGDDWALSWALTSDSSAYLSSIRHDADLTIDVFMESDPSSSMHSPLLITADGKVSKLSWSALNGQVSGGNGSNPVNGMYGYMVEIGSDSLKKADGAGLLMSSSPSYKAEDGNGDNISTLLGVDSTLALGDTASIEGPYGNATGTAEISDPYIFPGGFDLSGSTYSTLKDIYDLGIGSDASDDSDNFAGLPKKLTLDYGFKNLLLLPTDGNDSDGASYILLYLRRLEEARIELAPGNSPVGEILKDRTSYLTATYAEGSDTKNYVDLDSLDTSGELIPELEDLLSDISGKPSVSDASNYLSSIPSGLSDAPYGLQKWWVDAIKDFDTNRVSSYATPNTKYYKEAWNTYKAAGIAAGTAPTWLSGNSDFNGGIDYDGDMDPTALFVYQRKNFRDPGLNALDTLGRNVLGASRVVLTLKKFNGGTPTYLSGESVSNVVLNDTMDSSGYLINSMNGANIRPDVYILSYSFSDGKGNIIMAERKVVAISKLGDVRIDANETINNLDASAIIANMDKINSGNSVFAFRSADARSDDNLTINNLDSSRIISQMDYLNLIFLFYRELTSV